MKRFIPILIIFLLAVVGCSAAQVQTFVAGVLFDEPQAPLGGEIAALATPTPGTSALHLPTEAPTAIGPLATMTAIANLIATPDFNAEPYVITLTGKPHFIEFYARW